MLRIVSELTPTWVLGENVRGLLSIDGGMVFEAMCTDLEALDYEVWPLVLPAAGVGAPHFRQRVFIVGHTYGQRGQEPSQGGRQARERPRDPSANATHTDGKRGRPAAEPRGGPDPSEFGHDGSARDVADTATMQREEVERDEPLRDVRGDEDMAYTDCPGQQNAQGIPTTPRPYGRTVADQAGWWDAEPDVGRVADGVPHRVDRLRCLGNAIVPAQVYPILQAMAAVEASR